MPEDPTEDETVERGAAAGAEEEVVREERAAKRKALVVIEAGAEVLVPQKVKVGRDDACDAIS